MPLRLAKHLPIDPRTSCVKKLRSFLGGFIPTLLTGFPGVRLSVHVRKLVEAKLTNQMKIKVDCLDKWTPQKTYFIVIGPK